jgi:hypothetical protein
MLWEFVVSGRHHGLTEALEWRERIALLFDVSVCVIKEVVGILHKR